MQGDIVFYGADNKHSCGTLVVSALHHCGAWLKRNKVTVRCVAADDAIMPIALEDLRFRTGLRVSHSSVSPKSDPDAVFTGAALYVGVAVSTSRALEVHLAHKRHIPSLVAVQFPEPDAVTPAVLSTMRCAFDPKALADRLIDEVTGLRAGQRNVS